MKPYFWNGPLLFTLEAVKAMRDGNFGIAMLVDLEGAFDGIWIMGLIYKLWLAGIRGRLLMYIYRFLTGRRTRLIVNGKFS